MTHSTLPIIDLRSEDDYQQGHLKSAVHIPFEQLSDLWHELPLKGTEVTICVDDEYRSQAIELLKERDFLIKQVYSSQDLEQFPLETTIEHNRLWQGNPILEDHSELLLSDESSPVAIDVGCGSGRDSILMGQLGYRVIAIDVFDGALERLNHSARRWQLDIQTVEMDCRKHPQQLVDLFQQHQPKLIMQSRFLHRPLLDLYEQQLDNGAKVAIHTFLEGAAKFGKPKKADFLLKNDELSERFSHWSVLLDQVHHLRDGRPLSLFVAEKRLP